jgi:enamine deaminase RidA (YjgF/YER057c/UK114 family)
MATEAQLKLMMETVENQKADIKAKEQTIIDRNKELALLQQDLQDRDRHSRDFIKEQEEKFKLIIRELEDKLKAASLSGVTAPLVAGTGTSSPSSSALTDPYSTSTRAIGTAQLVTSGTSPTTATPASTDLATAVQHFRRSHRSPGVYKMGDDIESFICRFECYCKMDYMNESEKAGNLMLAMDPKIYPIIDRELTAVEKNDYDTLKRHLLKRFDIYKESGLRRVLFTMLKREVGETQEDYYSRLLDYGNKAITEETALTIDRMIRDQFMVRNDDKTREHLIGKAPKTSRNALSLAIAFQAAQTFTETLKDNTITISATEINENEFRRTDRKDTSKSDSSDKKRKQPRKKQLARL